MDFGGGMACGFASGMGSGIAVGISSGQKQARTAIQDYIDEQGITLQDRFGKPIDPDQMLAAASCKSGCKSNANGRVLGIALFVLGLVALLGLTIFLLMKFSII